jgi:DNA-binding PadR family transcriptional regulator
MRRGDKTLKLLEILKEAALDTADLLDAFITSGYGASLDTIQSKAADSSFRSRFKSDISKNEIKKEYNRFYSMVRRLEKDGLIEKKGKEKNKGKKNFFMITQKGKEKIGFLRNVKKRMGSLPSSDYKGRKSNRVTIVMFDIPEKERNKRAWLRSILGRMKFEMIQKSVWMGKVTLPKEFLNDLKDLKLIDFIEIFEITKTGSLKQLT